MRFLLCLLTLSLSVGSLRARGLLIPKDKNLPPLAMLQHHVEVTLEEQVAVTKIEQVFRNHTARPLEATYTFPVPEGASVNSFSMDVGGKRVKGEMLEANQARGIYTSMVQRSHDPGLLEHLGKRLFRVRVYPVPANGDQKLTLSFTSLANREKDLVEFVYPLKSKGKAVQTLESFAIRATLESQYGIQNVYSPSHALTIKRESDNKVKIAFEKKQATLSRDFRLFYQLSEKDVGLSTLTHRPLSSEDGYFLMMINPKLDLSKRKPIPRDMVFVLDTSGSMRGAKIQQARKAVNHCLERLNPEDRFSILQFSSGVNPYRKQLAKAGKEEIRKAKKWVQSLSATGGTAIHEALQSALKLRSDDKGRTFTVIFFTDGLPTIGESRPRVILESILKKKDARTRIFTFGVGDDVNAVLLDQLANQTRALATYVRPKEQIDKKVTRFFGKIRHPVLTGLALEVNEKITLVETFPRRLPDLFHDTQLTVIGRYRGEGATAVKLVGMVGTEKKEFIYEMTFPKKSKVGKEFVEHLWARRKVGYLLDQIRANGEKQELKDEVITLAKKYGITTPYTSYLVVPDETVTTPRGKAPGVPDVRFGRGTGIQGIPGGSRVPPGAFNGFSGIGGIGGFQGMPGVGRTPPGSFSGFGGIQGGIAGGTGGLPGVEFPKPHKWSKVTPRPGSKPTTKPKAPAKQQAMTVLRFAQEVTALPGGVEGQRIAFENATSKEQRKKAEVYRRARQKLIQGFDAVGKSSVDLSLANDALRRQSQVGQVSEIKVGGRRLLRIGVVWIDEKLTKKTPTLVVKALSKAYFEILNQQPKMKDVLQIGRHLVWITPSGVALVIDPSVGKEKLSEKEIAKLFRK